MLADNCRGHSARGRSGHGRDRAVTHCWRDGAVAMLKRRLLPMATLLITPNMPEAEALAGMAILTSQAMHRCGVALLTLGVPAVLLKGGHLPGDHVVDLLATARASRISPRRASTRHTHGTGCTLASGVASPRS